MIWHIARPVCIDLIKNTTKRKYRKKKFLFFVRFLALVCNSLQYNKDADVFTIAGIVRYQGIRSSFCVLQLYTASRSRKMPLNLSKSILNHSCRLYSLFITIEAVRRDMSMRRQPICYSYVLQIKSNNIYLFSINKHKYLATFGTLPSLFFIFLSEHIKFAI